MTPCARFLVSAVSTGTVRPASPSETTASLPEIDAAASGVVWLPGVPELGLETSGGMGGGRADGTVTRLISALDVDPWQDPDLAVLAILTAA